MPMTNEERAEHAGAAIAEYLASKGENGEPGNGEYEIPDLICDLLHHGDRFGYDHRKLVERALSYYREEKSEEAPVENLLRAAEAVIAAWENGNLAVAVRDLAESVRIARVLL